MRILIIGEFWEGSLERSYANAFAKSGLEVVRVDFRQLLAKYRKGGRLGLLVDTYFQVDAWNMRASRDLMDVFFGSPPDFVLIGGITPIRAGLLLQMKSAIPSLRIGLLWSDPMLYMRAHTMACLPFYDKILCFSKAGAEQLCHRGYNAVWHMFGADIALYPEAVSLAQDDRARHECDVLFVGNHRDERESLINQITAAGYKVHVWGSKQWKREARDWRCVKKYWQGRMLFGAEIIKAVRCAQVSLNVVDRTCPDAINMRMFEISASRGVQLCSTCREGREIFKDGETCYYYATESDAIESIGRIIRGPETAAATAERAWSMVRAHHSYGIRAEQVLRALGESDG